MIMFFFPLYFNSTNILIHFSFIFLLYEIELNIFGQFRIIGSRLVHAGGCLWVGLCGVCVSGGLGARVGVCGWVGACVSVWVGVWGGGCVCVCTRVGGCVGKGGYVCVGVCVCVCAQCGCACGFGWVHVCGCGCCRCGYVCTGGCASVGGLCARVWVCVC